MKFAICNEIFQEWSIEEAFGFAARSGYDAVEIAPFTLANQVTDLSGAERSRLRDLSARAGVLISGIHWVLVKTNGLHLTHPEAGVRDRTGRYFRELVKFCADLGGEFIVVGSPKQRELLPGVHLEQATLWATEIFRDAVKEGEDRGVTLCLEPLSPAETNFINTAAEAVEFVQRLDSSRFKVILDVKAMSAEARPIPQIIEETWPHFAYFHANDPNLKGPGFGDVNYVPIAAALRQVGYAGFVSVEVFNFEEGPAAIATQSREYLRRTFQA